MKERLAKNRTRSCKKEHGNTVLSNKEVMEILELFHINNLSQVELSNKYRVSQRLISYIVRGERRTPLYTKFLQSI